MPIEYRIQPTRKGDHIIRDQAGRELARRDTEPEAKAWIEAQEEKDRVEREEREAQAAEQETFDNAIPDLNKMQLRWQAWRNWFYDQLQREGNRTQQMRTHLDRLDSSLPSYNHHESRLTRDQQQLVEAQALYEKAVTLDGQIKQARLDHDAIRLAETLTKSEIMIEQMGGYFFHAARPDDAKPGRSGTSPNTSLILNQEELDFIDRIYGGKKSAAIHDALQLLMKQQIKNNHG